METDKLTTARAIMKGFTVLPTVPAAAAKAIRLLNEDDVDMGAVADVMLSDQVLAARVIRIVNSPLCKVMGQIQSVRQALVYLGPQRVFEIILTSCFLEVTDTNNRSPLRIQDCWEHAFGVGLVARRLAESIGYPQPEKAYVAGILHDVGEVILSQHRRQEYMRAMVLAKDEGIDLYDAEVRVFGTSHAEVGRLLGEQWNFPQEFVEVISLHHDSNLGVLPPLTLLVALADRFCIGVGLSSMGEQNTNKILGCADAVRLMQEHLPHVGSCDFDSLMISMEGLTDEVSCAVESIYS
ncbi:HDOD domain-containing protein [Trichlorobacter ammonificans]|uniref:Metal dependent phosphohydrolase n=1 Tax=Trichlorobacter ammonificans TaxID=2916410 RepID=A0ABN8HE59_9BACT|nr:HDOD domain-containing protein [Trichlorobacter ammonificans]CAH2031147.1 Metal dependent phosphohydrolase [Trichlorobacter ammonificans]